MTGVQTCALPISTLCVFLIQQPNFSLFILDAMIMEIGIHVLGTPAIILGNGADGDEVFAVQHHIVVTGLGAKFRNLLVLDGYGVLKCFCLLPLGFESRESIDGKVGIFNQIVHGI